MSAPLVKTLAPFTTYSSPSRTARVCSEARSVPASGSVYPMAKLTSPARMAGRKNDFCSSVPKRMMVGPTVFTVTNGNGALARRVSSKKMNWSVAGRPWPPNSLGHPMPSQPSLPMRPDDLAPQLAALAHLADALADLVGEQFGVVLAQLLAQGQLLGGFLQEHGAVLPPVRAGSPGPGHRRGSLLL